MKAVKVFDESFGLKLKSLRKSRGISLQRLSDLSGCSPSYISRLERNEKQSPSFPILVALANALKVDVLTLAEGLVDKEEIVDLYSIMFKSPLRVADKVLTEKETMLVLQMIERIVEFEWSRESQWHELAELGDAINKLKNVK